ncbi:MAG TPA: hypothetical protein VFX51_17785, partial [Solirubrobacteraceae bacterium]|nr:hypothetical protein [Solirubrobacteraceae bacterium]
LNVSALLGDKEFADHARDVLESYPRPDVVLVPDHAATTALRELALAKWNAPVHSIPLGPLAGEAREAVAGAEDVLVMDDVVISTQTLFGLRSRVYEVSQGLERDIRLWGFVVVARPSARRMWELVRARWSSRRLAKTTAPGAAKDDSCGAPSAP